MLDKQDKKYLHATFATREYLDENFVNKKDHNKFVDSVATEFLQVHRQFKAINKRFNKVDERLDGIDQRLDGIDQRFDKLEALIGEVLSEVRVISGVEIRSNLAIA